MSELRQLLDEIADAGEPRGADAVFGVASERAVVRRRTRHRRRMLSGIAGAVAVVVVVGAIARTTDTTKEAVRSVTVPPLVPAGGAGSAVRLAAGHWRTIPEAPIAPRDGYASVWTGKELFVWGGESSRVDKGRAPVFNDGAAYDPSTGSWHRLAPSPLGARMDAAAVWTGKEVVVWGGARGDATVADAAAYSPTTDTWRVLPPAPIPVSNYAFGAAVWTGDRVVVFAGHNAAVYDPEANQWQVLPPEPVHDSFAGLLAVAAGPGRVLLISQWEIDTPTGPSSFTGQGGSDVVRYDEQTNRWTSLHRADNAILEPQQAFWTGSQVLVRGDMYTPGSDGPGPLPEKSVFIEPDSGEVTVLSPDALDANHSLASGFLSAWTGRALLSWESGEQAGPIGPGDASVYDPISNTWRRLPSAPFGCGRGPVALFWTGTSVVTYCADPYPAQTQPFGGLELIPGP